MANTQAMQRALEVAAQTQFTDLATLYRWRSYHVFDSRRSHGGYPDLTLVRDRVIFAELKRQGEDPRADQVGWLDALASGGVEVYLWTLDDLQEAQRILSHAWQRDVLGLSTLAGESPWTPRSLWIPGHGRSDASG